MSPSNRFVSASLPAMAPSRPLRHPRSARWPTSANARRAQPGEAGAARARRSRRSRDSVEPRELLLDRCHDPPLLGERRDREWNRREVLGELRYASSPLREIAGSLDRRVVQQPARGNASRTAWPGRTMRTSTAVTHARESPRQSQARSERARVSAPPNTSPLRV